MWTPAFVLTTFVLGSIGGALCDQIHVRFGVLSYPRPDLFDQAWWVAPNFGLGTLAIVAGALPFARWSARAWPGRPTPASFVVGAAWFLGAYVASGLFKDRPAVLAAAYGAAFVVRLLPRPDRAPLAIYGVLLALGGSAYEGTLAGAGLFAYARPDVANVPMWLPGLYLHGAPLALALVRVLDARRAPAAAEKGATS